MTIKFTDLWRGLSAALSALVICAAVSVGVGQNASLAAGADSKVADNNYAVLIVGDESNTEMKQAEKELISEITKALLEKDSKGAYKYAKSRSGMQVFSYHLNHDREKQFCEKKLNIIGEDLLFVGIISLNNRLPERVIYRIDRVAGTRRAAVNIFDYAENLLANGPATSVASSSATTTAKTTGATSTTTSTKATTTPTAASTATSTSSATNATNTSNTEAKATETKTSATTTSTNAVVTSGSKTSTATASTSTTPPNSGKYAPVPEGKYLSCQIGAFSNEVNAADLVNQLKDKGYSARYRKFERSGGSFFYRVYSGSYSQRADAEDALNRLKRDGFDKAILVTLDK
ncbi:SPOR domain-containing protein [bacterium]|nr:SPOR domain-containing protein [bacterium]